MQNIESVLLQAISLQIPVSVTTKKWGKRIVLPLKLENGTLQCKVIKVEKLDDRGSYRTETISLAEVVQVE